jgi:Peptidase A4 family
VTVTSAFAGVRVEGSSVGIKPPARIQTVTAEWTVPTITPVAGESNLSLSVSFLVAVDLVPSGGVQNTGSLCAGVTATIFGPSVDYLAIVAWAPSPATTALSFPVKAGDILSVIINVADIHEGIFFFSNKTSGQSMTLGIANLLATIQGASAEWLVEMSSADLPDFSQVTFTNVSFGTGSQTFNLSNSSGNVIFNITDSNGKALTSTSVTSATAAQVKWLRSS